MNVKNAITAKIMGEILAEGMSLCDVDLGKTVNSEAVGILSEVSEILDNKKIKNNEKVKKIRLILQNIQ